MSAHTPGPWGLDSDGDVRSSHTEKNGFASEYVATLLFANYRDERIEERLPNARLIAAAPELFSALQGLVERGTDSPQHMAAEAAIAKALGK